MGKFTEKFISKSLEIVLSDRFGRYSKYIIQQRALPDARDGLKPVQRRILYSMWELGLKNDKPFKKSARVVGDVIGKYHPHGDSSIYEAMVRMAQEWKMGVPLIEMHGNKGSIDDDPAAAMRYTETRLESITNLMLESIDKKTVSFAPNFDDSETEPTVLPSLIPNLLINGAKGIASGFATEIPPHNLGEVLDATIAKVKNPGIEFRKLAEIVKGPDFPTGGTIYGRDGILEAFERGKGRLILVSKYKIIDEKNKKSIEIYEIPFGVVKSKLVKDIDEIRIDKKISGIKEVIDQSDRNGVSILIELENDAKVNTILNYLLQKTEMQIYYSYNSIAIKNNAPKLMSLNDMIESYLSHIKDFKTKELKYDLEKDERKLEITLALIKAGDITEEIIKIIRNSDNSKKGVIEALMNNFNFSEIQATAIAEMRLYRLSRIDQNLYISEKQMLEDRIALNKKILSDEKEFNNYLINIFKEIKKTYATERKTEIVDSEFKIEINQEELIKNEQFYIGLSKDGYLKKFSLRVYESNDLSTYSLKEQDPLIFLDKVESVNKLLIFTNLGNYIYLPIHKIEDSKWKDFGIHLNNFVSLKSTEKIVSAILVKDFNVKNYVVLISSQGIGKKVLIKDFEVSRFNKTLTAIKLKNKDDYLINAKLSNNYKDILIINSEGKAVKYSEIEIPIYNTNSSGVKLISLAKDVLVEAFELIENDQELILFTRKSQFKKIKTNNIGFANKNTQGKKIFAQNKINKFQIIDAIAINELQLDLAVFDIDNKINLLNTQVVNISSLEEGFGNSKNKNSYFVSNLKLQVVGTENSSINSLTNDENENFDSSSVSKDENNTETKHEKEKNFKFEREKKILKTAEEKLKSLDDLDIDSLIKKFKDL
ncbi:DNA topoisomerase IV subunit A [Mesomycoplasma lagogenitalium]|uniref:DNA topoisomerase (ATP-hydrolyzing) n=1 Tax=Mesomycoplasma lagogenitalium TaxID=171286 RepID=A0ABY8LUC3_9BACT|nr:DNA topoisomerase IV subunit A [Mesomycoplasma lagogenitalium]WGI36831.1 DNA topoisomerase IV subunit A [Mesomycoplasma lagogenitalium]